jgi:phage replication initiation protein
MFLGSTRLRLDREQRGRRNFYECHWRIVTPEDQVCGFIAVGGNAGTFCLDLTGKGCSYVQDWNLFAQTCDESGAALTRVDCAHDDYSGTHSISDAVALYDAGAFARGGRPPCAEYIDDKGSNRGKTLYVGRNSGNQTLCVYEKGKQLGDPESPWVRYEGRFGNKYRDIPTDVLRRPGDFLAGMWPCLSWISDVADRFATAAKQAAASTVALARHVKRQYGRFLNFARSVYTNPADFTDWVGSLCRPGLPAKLKLPHVGTLISVEKWRSELCVSS